MRFSSSEGTYRKQALPAKHDNECSITGLITIHDYHVLQQGCLQANECTLERAFKKFMQIIKAVTEEVEESCQATPSQLDPVNQLEFADFS